jgi:hypothetical protein
VRMASQLAAERDDNLVVDELEQIAAGPHPRPPAAAGPPLPQTRPAPRSARPVNPPPPPATGARSGRT